MRELLCIACLATVYTVQAVEPMTVQDAIEIGLKNNYDIQIARNSATMAKNNRGLGTAEFLPTLDASGSAAQLHSVQDTNSPFSFGTTDSRNYNGLITLNWTLFDGFGMFASNARFRELAKLGDYQARDVVESNIVAILSGYFNLVQQEQLLDVAQNSAAISETRLNKEQVRRDLGGASSTDYLDAQVALNQDKALVLNQEIFVMTARQDLNVLLGQDPVKQIEVKKDIVIPPVDMEYEQLLELARQRNSRLMVARQNKIVADESIKLARSAFFPFLSLGADYGYTDRTVSSDRADFTDDIITTSRDGSISLRLSWNLFNGNRDRINLQNAQLDARNTELALLDSENRLSGLIQEQLLTFRNRMQRVELEEQNVVAAEQNLELWSERFQIGSASSIEFRDAQVNLLRAHSALIVARYQARITRLEIERLIGNLRIE